MAVQIRAFYERQLENMETREQKREWKHKQVEVRIDYKAEQAHKR